jgi:outer membrane protein OmpA-like peptidoglycan-associated protein
MFSLPADAQTAVFDGQIPVRIKQLRQVDDSVQVALEFDFSNLSLGTQRSLLLTPTIISPQGKTYKLRNIMLNGYQRQKAFIREVELNGWGNQIQDAHYDIIGLNNDSRTTYDYALSVEFEDWMRDARMEIASDLCDCGGEAGRISSDKIANRIILEGVEAYRVLPNVAYIRPEVEAVKARSQSNDVFLDFPVSQTDINPGFGNNPRELAKIQAILKGIQDDKNVQVTGITITGYASPEGDINFNNQLSRGRAEALRNLLASRAGIPPYLYHVGFGGEDWDGLIKALQNSYIQPKETITSIIRYYNPTERKDRLKALGGGQVWQRMLYELFPPLRRVESKIEYNVRGFNVDEAKEIIKTRPQQLSMNEMFLVANTYEEGSKEFEDVFATMVKVFPDDPVANLNAAASALLIKDLPAATKYLQKAQRNTPAYYNNLGVLSMMQGNLARAKSLFQRAAQAKLAPALKNLEEVKKKEEIDAQLTN